MLQADSNSIISCFYRDSVDETPECIRILFSALMQFNYRANTTTCVMITVYPPTSVEDMVSARENNRQTFCAMGAHADGMHFILPCYSSTHPDYQMTHILGM